MKLAVQDLRFVAKALRSIPIYLPAAGCAALAMACHGNDGVSSMLAQIECTEGEKVTFNIESLPNLAEKTLQVPGSTTNYILKNPEPSYNARFDACVVGERVDLKKIVFQEDSLGVRSVFVKGPAGISVGSVFNPTTREIVYTISADAWEEAGFAAAVTANKYDDLRIVLHLQPDDKEVWLLGGVKAFDQEFVTASFGRRRNGYLVPGSLYLLTGSIAVGDPFLDGPCLPGEIESTSRFALGAAQFNVKMCSFLGGGHTMGYKWHYLEVTDTNPQLTPDEQRPLILTGVDSIKAKVNYRWNHHNGCDSFHADFGYAQYAATSAALAGCGMVVPNAPERTGPALSSGNVLYRTKYHDDPWLEGVLEQHSHYLTFFN